MEITSYLYKNAASSYSGSTWVTIRMWGATASTRTRAQMFHWCLNAGHSLVGEGENQKSCKFISVTRKKKY